MLNSEKRNIHDKCIIYYHQIEIFPTQLFVMRVLHIVFNVPNTILGPFSPPSLFLFRKINNILCMGLGRLKILLFAFFSSHRYTRNTHTHTEFVDCGRGKTADDEKPFYFTYVQPLKNPSRTKPTKSVVRYFSYSYSYSGIFALFSVVSVSEIARIHKTRETKSKTKKMTSFCPWENGFSFCHFSFIDSSEWINHLSVCVATFFFQFRVVSVSL